MLLALFFVSYVFLGRASSSVVDLDKSEEARSAVKAVDIFSFEAVMIPP